MQKESSTQAGDCKKFRHREYASRPLPAVATQRSPFVNPVKSISCVGDRLGAERFRQLSFAADLEGAEVLVPRSIRRLGLGLPPRLQLVEILGGDLALAQPSRTGGREPPEEGRSTGSSASLTEGHAGEFFLETFLLLRIAGAREAVGAFEEALFFLLPSIQPGLDKIGDDAAGARLAGLRQRLHPAPRCTTMHQVGADHTPTLQYPPLRRLSGSPAILPACLEGLPG